MSILRGDRLINCFMNVSDNQFKRKKPFMISRNRNEKTLNFLRVWYKKN